MIRRYQYFLDQYKQQILPWVIISVLFTLSAVLSPMIAQGNRRYMLVFVLYIGVAAVIILLRFPQMSLVSLVVASLLIPFRISIINAFILLIILLIALWILEMLVRDRAIRFLSSRPLLPAVLFAAAAVLSFGFGQLPWFQSHAAPITAQIGQLSLFLLAVGVFVLIAHKVELRGIEWMVWLFLILGGIYMAGRILPILSARRLITSIFQRTVYDSLFWTWMMALSFSQAFFNTQLSKYWRAALVFLIVIIAYISLVIAQAWTSGWLPSLVAIGIIVWVGAPHLRSKGIWLVVLLAVVNYQKILGVLMVGDNEYSLLTRVEAWRIMFEVIKVNPIFGLGPANYYWYSALFPILGYYVPFNSHNNYIDIIAQTGLVGLVLFLWFMWEIGKVGWSLRDRVPDGFPRAFVYGCLGGLGGMVVAGMLGDWLIPFVYNVGIEGFRASGLAWIFLGALIAMDRIYKIVEDV